MTTYFTSDTHFGHARIIELSNRPFKDVDHMNAEIVRRWNETVMPDDIVFHLGDVALGKIDDSLAVVKQLNGYKILVNGNHDRPFMSRGKARFQEWETAYYRVFQEQVLGNLLDISLSDGTKVNLSHFPYDGDSHGGDRYAEDRIPDLTGVPLIHGHTHMDNKFSRSATGSPQVHVGQDAWDFTPVSEAQVLDILANA